MADEETDIVLSVEEVTAMILRYAKRISDKMAGADIKDCVVTVPSHWNLDQR